MRLLKCCCCISLQFGTMIIGCIFGIKDFSLGCIAVYYVTRKELPMWLIKFFDKMDARYSVLCFAFVFYLMSFSDLLLISGAMAKNPAYMGPWLIVHFIVLICTIATALLNALAVIRIILIVYAMLVVNSYYEELTA
ncbi:uncharacterized protein LOC115758272 [Drosophila novamexicana]|uniref:uncharacterized protein LOC115758272 n=1 Tax=Drosophila novamexicana TaxID=47314 RepID=UPI0011E59903|nr:uncharacterized protein LOC115758272 [Drosophila novamexicana]